MLRWLKKILYFPIAHYFKFFAQIQLARWKPRIILITGSSGKTTLLHLIESQIKQEAKYSYQANSAYGISFDILGLKRSKLVPTEWLYLFFAAPFKALSKSENKKKFYIVEADCDRPGEGNFLAGLLKPEVTLWASCGRTHSASFDPLVAQQKFNTTEDATAFEFGYFLEQTIALVIVNGDLELITNQLKRTKAPVKIVKKENQFNNYKLKTDSTEFIIDDKRYSINALLPREVFYSIAMTDALLAYLNIKSDPYFSDFRLPPGRSSLFKGKNDTIIIDSTYNATLDGMAAILRMFDCYPARIRWAVLGDMIEQGKAEQEEHEKLAEIITQINLDKIILIGPRVSQYTYPKLKLLVGDAADIEKFVLPKEVLAYLQSNIKGGETILFKGARFLEGVIEPLLASRDDTKKLCRREKIWQIRRNQWKL